MLTHAIALIVSLVSTPASVAPLPPRTPDKHGTPLVRFPHPLITEILAVVPTGDEGDANGDGARDATADEFVELMNPHNKPIRLGGYTISDRNAGGRSGIEFTFPPLTLKPGEVVVVFNGGGTAFAAHVGSARGRARQKDAAFGAWVFGMEYSGRFRGFANKGDWVLLSDPDGRPVHVVSWGEFEERLPTGKSLVRERPEDDGGGGGSGGGSLCRRLVGGPMVGHRALDGELFSPGRHPVKEEAAPDEPAAGAQATGQEPGR